MDDRQERMCSRKVAFIEAAARARGRELGLRPYQCPYCQEWHLTHVGVEQLLQQTERHTRRARRASARKQRFRLRT